MLERMINIEERMAHYDVPGLSMTRIKMDDWDIQKPMVREKRILLLRYIRRR